jgi:hypothetical protein
MLAETVTLNIPVPLYQRLLDRHQEGTISDSERLELTELRREADRFMLRKAHAAVLLRWRGRNISTL